MATVTATLIELAKRIVKIDTKLGVHLNGADNNYPERVERTINNSATAKPCATLMKKYIIGKGFDGIENDFVVNKEKGLTIKDLLAKVAHNYCYQKGAFIHENINLNFKATSIDVLPFGHCRIGKKDDKKYNGKIGVHDGWSPDGDGKSKVKPDQIELFDVHNTDKNVREAQIKKAGDIKKYKGQVYFINPEETIYPLAHVDNVLNDADSEFRASTFKNVSLRKGFFGKMVCFTKPLLGDLAKKPKSELTEIERLQYSEAENQRDAFKDTLRSFVGSQNADGILHLEVDFEGDDIEKAMGFKPIDTNIDDKLFEYTEKSAANNIRKAFSNVPSILIENADNSIFGNSGEMLVQAKLFYNEETQDERDYIASEITKIMSNFEGFNMPKGGLKIKPLIEKEATPTPDGNADN